MCNFSLLELNKLVQSWILVVEVGTKTLLVLPHEHGQAKKLIRVAFVGGGGGEESRHGGSLFKRISYQMECPGPGVA